MSILSSRGMFSHVFRKERAKRYAPAAIRFTNIVSETFAHQTLFGHRYMYEFPLKVMV